MVHQQAIKIRRESRTSFITKAILYQRVSWIIQVRLLFDRKTRVRRSLLLRLFYTNEFLRLSETTF